MEVVPNAGVPRSRRERLCHVRTGAGSAITERSELLRGDVTKAMDPCCVRPRERVAA